MPSQSATTTMQHVLSSSLVCSFHSGLEVDSNSHQSLEKDNSAVSSKAFFLKKNTFCIFRLGCFVWANVCIELRCREDEDRWRGQTLDRFGPSFSVGDGEEGVYEDFDKSLFLFLSFFWRGTFRVSFGQP